MIILYSGTSFTNVQIRTDNAPERNIFFLTGTGQCNTLDLLHVIFAHVRDPERPKYPVTPSRTQYRPEQPVPLELSLQLTHLHNFSFDHDNCKPPFCGSPSELRQCVSIKPPVAHVPYNYSLIPIQKMRFASLPNTFLILIPSSHLGRIRKLLLYN